MTEVTYIPEVKCEVSSGLLESEYTVSITDLQGRREFLRVPKKLIGREGRNYYVPVGIVELDRRDKKALIELPHESDSGVNRLWVPFTFFRTEGKNA